MANSISAQASLQITATGATARGSRAVSLTQSGTTYRQDVSEVAGSAETLNTGDLTDIRYCYITNPSVGATLTVTCAAMILKPGDVMLFQPSTINVTMQATGAIDVQSLIVEA